MKVGPKYKIARRLGAQVFEKTQGKKYAIRESNKTASKGAGRPKTDFAVQRLEKQKVRFTYVVSERQFKNYINEVLKAASAKPEEKLWSLLESRLDNAVLRGGLAHTRFLARQLVSHGHITLNGVKTDVPSCRVKKGDVIAVRDGSKDKAPFQNLVEKTKDTTIPAWLKLDPEKKLMNVVAAPAYNPVEVPFSLTSVLEYYKR